jgi:hypothetical protein
MEQGKRSFGAAIYVPFITNRFQKSHNMRKVTSICNENQTNIRIGYTRYTEFQLAKAFATHHNEAVSSNFMTNWIPARCMQRVFFVKILLSCQQFSPHG